MGCVFRSDGNSAAQSGSEWNVIRIPASSEPKSDDYRENAPLMRAPITMMAIRTVERALISGLRPARSIV